MHSYIVFHDTLYTNHDRYDMVITNNTRWIISIMINHLPTHGIDLPNMNKTKYVSIWGETHTVSFLSKVKSGRLVHSLYLLKISKKCVYQTYKQFSAFRYPHHIIETPSASVLSYIIICYIIWHHLDLRKKSQSDLQTGPKFVPKYPPVQGGTIFFTSCQFWFGIINFQ